MKISISSRKKLMRLVPSATAIAVIFTAVLCFAQSKQDIENTFSIHVTSDKMVAQQDQLMVEFIGNVKAIRQESTLTADSVKLFFMGNDKKTDEIAQSSIEKIVSTGNVQYTEKNRDAYADQAVYIVKDDILILTGTSPKLKTGQSFVTGKKITLFRKQDKVVVESDGTKRVEALFNPEDNFSNKP